MNTYVEVIQPTNKYRNTETNQVIKKKRVAAMPASPLMKSIN